MMMRMDTAKEALKLFLKSLPVGSLFSIISFGSEMEIMEIGGKSIIKYNEENTKEAISRI